MTESVTGSVSVCPCEVLRVPVIRRSWLAGPELKCGSTALGHCLSAEGNENIQWNDHFVSFHKILPTLNDHHF